MVRRNQWHCSMPLFVGDATLRLSWPPWSRIRVSLYWPLSIQRAVAHSNVNEIACGYFFEKLQFDKDELESRTAKIATIPEDLQLLPESSHPYSADRPKAIRPLPWHYWRALWPRANHLKVAGESRALVSHHSNFILCLCRTARTLAKRCGISACPPRLPTQACLGSCPELCPELALEREAWRKFTGGAWIITLLTVGVLPIILYDKELMIVACPIAAKCKVI